MGNKARRIGFAANHPIVDAMDKENKDKEDEEKPKSVEDDKPTTIEPVKDPVLYFSGMAWEKIKWMARHGDTEIGGFGLAEDPNQPLLITDFILVKQESSSGSIDFDDDGLGDYDVEMIEEGYVPNQFRRVWIHTHPGSSATPSGTDEAYFTSHFGRFDWAIMFIMAKDCKAVYARLRSVIHNAGGPPIFVDREIPVRYFGVLDDLAKDGDDVTVTMPRKAWRDEVKDKVKDKWKSQSYNRGYNLPYQSGHELGGVHGPKVGVSNTERPSEVSQEAMVMAISGGTKDADGKPIDKWGRRIHLRKYKDGWRRKVEGGRVKDSGDLVHGEIVLALEDFYTRIFDWDIDQSCADLLCGRIAPAVENALYATRASMTETRLPLFLKQMMAEGFLKPLGKVDTTEEQDSFDVEAFMYDMEQLDEIYKEILAGKQVPWEDLEQILDLDPKDVALMASIHEREGAEALIRGLKDKAGEVTAEFCEKYEPDPNAVKDDAPAVDDDFQRFMC